MTQWGLDTLFNPAKRHMDEEKRRLQSTREEVGDASGGKRIDLESGKVVISRASEDSGDGSEPDSGAADSGAGAAAQPPARSRREGAQSPAAQRAAQRRARKS